MEAKVIEGFLPDLVIAISDCVQPVSDQCLAKGLIPDSVYKRVLESGGTSEDKARTLILAIKTSTETDGGCLEILLSILDKQLTYVIKEKLLSEIRKELTEKANTVQTLHLLPSEELLRESAMLQSSLLGKFEDVIRQHERACTEKNILEERLKAKVKEYESSKQEFETLSSQSTAARSIHVPSTQSLITDCEHEIDTLREKIRKLEHTIEEQGMKVKRGRHIVILENEKLLEIIVKNTKSAIREEARRTEEHKFTVNTQEMNSRIKESEHRIKEYESLQSHDMVPTDRLSEYEIRHLQFSGLQSIKRSPHWRNIGSQLGFTTEELDGIEKDKTKDKLFKMLNQWARWYPGDRRGSNNFATYSGLQTALIKLGLMEIVCAMLPYTTLCTYNANF